MKAKRNYPLIIFSFVTLAFFVFFTHLIIKTDDGHFLGILNEENFALKDWLVQRYQTVSGRTVSEFLMMNFLKINPIFWKIFASVSFVFIAWFFQKISGIFSGFLNETQKKIFACCVPFLPFIGALNSGAFWFAGSFTFLFPFAAFLLAVLPMTFDLLGIKYRRIPFCFMAAAGSLLACSQEQTTALTLSFWLFFILILSVKKIIKVYHFLSIPFGVLAAHFLFSSPGMAGRMKMENVSFPRFSEMNFIEKILCGFSNYFAYSFFMSIIVTGIFALLLTLAVYDLYESKKVKNFSKFFIGFFAAVSCGMNLIYIAINKIVPDKGFQKVFQSGEYDFINILTVALCFILLFLISAMLILLIKKIPQAGVAIAVCFAAAVCSGVVMGFSSSIYASGQRVFYFTDMLTLAASTVLISSMKNKKSLAIYNAAILLTLIMFIFNCFNFALLEIPVMG